VSRSKESLTADRWFLELHTLVWRQPCITLVFGPSRKVFLKTLESGLVDVAHPLDAFCRHARRGSLAIRAEIRHEGPRRRLAVPAPLAVDGDQVLGRQVGEGGAGREQVGAGMEPDRQPQARQRKPIAVILPEEWAK
jgi:hypothetical protein